MYGNEFLFANGCANALCYGINVFVHYRFTNSHEYKSKRSCKRKRMGIDLPLLEFRKQTCSNQQAFIKQAERRM